MTTSNTPRRQLIGRNAAIARIVSGIDGTHVGMGIVIAPRRVLTCAHVVNQALGRDDGSTVQPDERLLLEFPLHTIHASRVAAVSAWHPINSAGRPGDVAVLTLIETEKDIEAEIGVGIFADVSGRTIDGDPLSVYGIVAGERTGEHVKARFVGFARESLAQADSTGEGSRLIRPGFSGAAVFDEREQAIVGLTQGLKIDSHLAARGASDAPKAAVILPALQLAEFVVDLPLEERARPAWFAPVWSLVATALFVFSIAHIWVTQQGTGWINGLALESRHPQVAAFYGMHLIALLGLIVSWLLLLYVRDFARSHWSQRVPPLPFFHDRWAPVGRRVMGAVVIALFVVVPVYTQAHLLRKFHGEGNVYAHVGTFGIAAWGAEGPRDCVGGGFCMHADAGLYSVMRAAPGAPGGYFDYAYKYGEPRAGLELEAVTFFPGIQPAFIIALNAWSAVLLFAWLRLLVRPAADARATNVTKASPPCESA